MDIDYNYNPTNLSPGDWVKDPSGNGYCKIGSMSIDENGIVRVYLRRLDTQTGNLTPKSVWYSLKELVAVEFNTERLKSKARENLANNP